MDKATQEPYYRPPSRLHDDTLELNASDVEHEAKIDGKTQDQDGQESHEKDWKEQPSFKLSESMSIEQMIEASRMHLSKLQDEEDKNLQDV